MELKKQALLVVSFGTSYRETAAKNIEAVEQDLQQAFPTYNFFRAYTSKIIRQKLLQRDHVRIYSVEEALETMYEQGYTHLVVQPTHIIAGHEYQEIVTALLTFQPKFESIRLGKPLLNEEADLPYLAHILQDAIRPYSDEETAIVYMGHGSSHQQDAIYTKLETCFRQAGCHNVFVGTAEGQVSLDDLLPKLQAGGYAKILLLPLMLVAGDHARHDMAGSAEGAWRFELEKRGFHVNCLLRGLGEIPAIRDIYIQHADHGKELGS